MLCFFSVRNVTVIRDLNVDKTDLKRIKILDNVELGPYKHTQ